MSSYNERHGDTNLDALDVALEQLDDDQQRTAVQHLLGAVAGYIDPATWADLVDQARRFAEETDR